MGANHLNVVELQDEVLERLAAQTDKLKNEGDVAVERFIQATITFRTSFLLDAVRAYLKNETNKAFSSLEVPRRLALRDDVLTFVETDPQRVRGWLSGISWPHRKRAFRDADREFNKPTPDYNQLEATVKGLTDGLALVLKRHGLGMPKDQETVRKIHASVPHADKWTVDMNEAWDQIENVRYKIGEIEKERDERISTLTREKIAREIDELFLGSLEEVTA